MSEIDKYEKILLTTPITSFKLTELQKEIIHMLRILRLNDRKLQIITIGLNPKFKKIKSKGNQESPLWFQNVVLENLNTLKKAGLVRNQEELWSLNENLKFKEKEMTDLEKEMLIFIDESTWDKEQPKKVKMYKDGRIGRAKISYMSIRWIPKGIKEKIEKRFTESNIEFNKILNILKARKLITSRTKCQIFAGLTCTKIGHKLSIINKKSTINS